MAALDWGKRTERRVHIATHPGPGSPDAVCEVSQIEVVVTPYSAGSKEKPLGSMFEHSTKA
jgi:hypothetical protein